MSRGQWLYGVGAYTRADQPDVPVDDGHPPPLEDDPVPPGTPAPPPPSLDRSELTFLVLVASALGALAIAVIVVFAFCVANGLFGF